MNDDELNDYAPFLDDSGYDPPQRSRSRSCLFLVVSLLIIVSLVASSLAAWFVVGRQERLAAEQARSAAGDAESPRIVPSQPTAAPATVVAALPTAAPAEPVTSTLAVNRIAIVNGEGQVETLSPNGDNRRILTSETRDSFYQFPTWSPDGQNVAVIGNEFGGGGIYVFPDQPSVDSNAAEQQVYFSADETPFYLYWSPDSQNLAFLANQTRNTMGLKVVAGNGEGESRLLATGTPFYWDWTDDGRQLLIHTGQGREGGGLSLIDVDGETQADNLATPGEFQAPGIAPGGRYWAFAEQADGGLSSLVVIDTQTGEREAYDQSGSLALSWSPTRDQIAFTHSAIGGHSFWGPLHVLDVPGGQTRVLSRQTVLAFFWSPNGRSIAFITISRDIDDDGVNVSAAGRTRRVARVAAPAQQRQGFLTLSVVDVETGRGLRLLDFEPTRVFLSQFMPFFDQYALSHRIWSPDSQSVVLPVREADGNVVLIVPVEGGRPHRLAAGDVAFWSHQ